MSVPQGYSPQRVTRRSGAFHRYRWAVAATALMACNEGGGNDATGTTAAGMPQLVETPLPLGQRPVSSVLTAVVVGADGAVLVRPVDRDGPSFTLVGAPDGVVREYGGQGEGPGEMRMAQPMLVHDTAVVGYDLATRRLMVFDRASGSVQRTLRPEVPVVPFMRGPGATLLATQSDRGVELPMLVDLGSGRVRSVVSPSDSYRVALFADDDQLPDGTYNSAVVGRWGNGVVLANGMTYRVGLYDVRGVLRYRIDRNIAPRQLTPSEIELELSRLANTPMGRTPERLARARERLEATPTRWFTHQGPPRSDGHDRLWVMLEHGDSTLADVYSGDQLLGRTRLDCPGFSGHWDLVGDWLVLLCVPSDPAAEYDAEVKRWRIVEPGG